MTYDFIAIRQALSMAIFMISIPFIIDRKFFHYAALIAIASMIHLSALVLIPLYFFIHYSYNKVLFYLVLLLTTSVSVLKVDIQLVSLLLNYFALPDFASNKLDVYTQEDVFAALSVRQLLLGFVFVFFFSFVYSLLFYQLDLYFLTLSHFSFYYFSSFFCHFSLPQISPLVLLYPKLNF